jgi:LPXTG-motif cell wall-anchored protein
MRRFRRKVAVHVSVLSAAAVLCLTVGTSTTGAAPTVQDDRHLTADTAEFVYDCTGGNSDTQTILDTVGLPTFNIDGQFTSVAVYPSPSPGEEFNVDFIWDFELPQELVEIAVGAGADSLINQAILEVMAVSGASGPNFSQLTDPVTVALGDGSVPVGYTIGPLTATFTRTAAVDEPITFEALDILTQAETPSGIQLVIDCDIDGDSTLVMGDLDGPPETTTTTTRPEVVETTTTTTTAGGGGGVGGSGEELPATGTSSNLWLALLAVMLIDLGYLAVSGSKLVGRRASSVS